MGTKFRKIYHCFVIFTFLYGLCECQIWPKLFERDKDPLSIDGSWSSWQSWSPCYKNIDSLDNFYRPLENFLIQSRNRTCTAPKPLHGGRQCEPPSHRFRQCSCTNPLGMSNGLIKDDDLTSNRALKAYPPSHARFGKNFTGWCAKKLSYLRQTFLQIDFDTFVTVSSIETQGTKNGRIRHYQLEYSLNGKDWQSVNNKKTIYKGNLLPETLFKNEFESSQVLKYLRLIPTEAFEYPCLKMELYGCSFTCGGHLTPSFGNVVARSSEFIDQNCLWNIEVRNTTSLTFDFNVFYVKCEDGYLDFYDGDMPFKNSVLLKRVCLKDEDEEVPILKLNYNTMWLNFVSNSSSTEVGFNIQYFSECDQVIHLQKGESLDISSPNYPNNYFNNLQCVWTLYAPDTEGSFQVRVNEFKIESSQDTGRSCPDDIVRIKSKHNGKVKEIGSYCNNFKPSNTFTVLGEEMIVTFTSDTILAGKGFSFTVVSGTTNVIPTTIEIRTVIIEPTATVNTTRNGVVTNDKNNTMFGKKIRKEERDDTWTIIIICVFTAFALILLFTVAGMNIRRYVKSRNELNAQCAKIRKEKKQGKKHDKIDKVNKEYFENENLINKTTSPTKVRYKDAEHNPMLANAENDNKPQSKAGCSDNEDAADVIEDHVEDCNGNHNDTLDDIDGNIDSSSYDSSSPQVHSPLKTEVVIGVNVDELDETVL